MGPVSRGETGGKACVQYLHNSLRLFPGEKVVIVHGLGLGRDIILRCILYTAFIPVCGCRYIWVHNVRRKNEGNEW